MKVTVLNGSMPGFDNGIDKVVKMVKDILAELDVDVNDINLALHDIPYYDGVKSVTAGQVVESIYASSGIVFTAASRFFSVPAGIQAFFEHLEYKEYEGALKNKNCMIITASKNGGERYAMEYLSRIINFFEGFDSVRIGLNSSSINSIENDENVKTIIEKQVEDFYRIIRQERRFIIPKDTTDEKAPDGHLFLKAFSPEESKKISDAERRLKVPVSEIYKKLDLDTFTKEHEDEIDELTSYFTKKLDETKNESTAADNNKLETSDIFSPTWVGGKGDQFMQRTPITGINPDFKPRSRTVRQLTQSMPHYFQPHLSNGLNMCLQLNITGMETFNGYLDIQNTECEYHEGQAASPDITIIADSIVWQDVIKGRNTAQKTFMVGKLKVRGNFILLTRLEQLFKPII